MSEYKRFKKGDRQTAIDNNAQNNASYARLNKQKTAEKNGQILPRPVEKATKQVSKKLEDPKVLAGAFALSSLAFALGGALIGRLSRRRHF